MVKGHVNVDIIIGTVRCTKPEGSVRLGSGGVRMHLSPVASNVDATAEPDAIETAHIVQEFDQPHGTRRAADSDPTVAS